MKKLICPYCGDEKSGDEIGCCGESRAHFEEIDTEKEAIEKLYGIGDDK